MAEVGTRPLGQFQHKFYSSNHYPFHWSTIPCLYRLLNPNSTDVVNPNSTDVENPNSKWLGKVPIIEFQKWSWLLNKNTNKTNYILGPKIKYNWPIINIIDFNIKNNQIKIKISLHFPNQLYFGLITWLHNT